MSRFSVVLLATLAMLYITPATLMPFALSRAPRDVVAVAFGQDVYAGKNLVEGGIPTSLVINSKPKTRSGWCLHAPT